METKNVNIKGRQYLGGDFSYQEVSYPTPIYLEIDGGILYIYDESGKQISAWLARNPSSAREYTLVTKGDKKVDTQALGAEGFKIRIS